MLFINDERKNKYGSFARLIAVVNESSVLVEYSDPAFVEVDRQVIACDKFVNGTFSSPFDRRVQGVGYVGVGKYKPSEHVKCYRAWKTRIVLGWVEDFKNRPAYVGVSISDDVLNFQKFAEWWYSQNGHDEIGFEVDKDLKGKKNGLWYSFDTMSIIPSVINQALRRRYSSENDAYLISLAKEYQSRIEPSVYDALLEYYADERCK